VADRTIRNRKAGKRSVKLVVIVAAVLAVVLTFSIVRLYRENKTLQKNIEALNNNVEIAQEKNQELNERRNTPLSEEEMIRIAHEKFGLVFPNEIVFVPED